MKGCGCGADRIVTPAGVVAAAAGWGGGGGADGSITTPPVAAAEPGLAPADDCITTGVDDDLIWIAAAAGLALSMIGVLVPAPPAAPQYRPTHRAISLLTNC